MRLKNPILALVVLILAACSTGSAVQNRPEPLPNRPTMAIEEEKSSSALSGMAAPKTDEAPADAMKLMAESSDKKVAGDSGAETSLQGPKKIDTQARALKKLPGLLARISGDDQTPLPLEAQGVLVLASGTRARVVLDLVFSNPTDRQLSGNLMVEMPQGASPAYLGMFLGAPAAAGKDFLTWAPPAVQGYLGADIQVGASWKIKEEAPDWGTLRNAKVVEAAQGRQIYEQQVRSRVDPALSEWTGGSNFSSRIFPLPPKSLKRVVFIYDRPLPVTGGQLALDLPPLAPGKHSSLYTEVLGTGFRDLQVLGLAGAVTPEKTGVWRIPGGKEPQFFTLVGAPTRSFRTLMGQQEGIKGTLGQVLWNPEFQGSAQKRSTGKAIFLVDTSLSGKSRLYNLTGRLLRQILERDPSITEFQVYSFDVTCRPVSAGWTPNTPAAREPVFKNLEAIRLEGATNFQGALEVLSQDPRTAEAQAVFLLSDGQITWGTDTPGVLERSFGDLFAQRWITYTFGDSPVNKPLLEKLIKSGGQQVALDREENLPGAATAHLQSTLSVDSFKVLPETVEAYLTGDGGPISPGQTLEISLRAPAGLKSCTLVLQASGQEKRLEVDLSVDPRSSALGARAWAEAWASRLLAQGDPRADQAALAFSQKFTLSNRLASFLILERDEDFKVYELKEPQLNLLLALRTARSSGQGAKPGELDFSSLTGETQKFLDQIKAQKNLALWRFPPSIPLSLSVEDLKKSRGRQKDTPLLIYQQAKDVLAEKPGDALRILSSIPEVNPGDDQGLRMVGFVLMEWGLYSQAGEVFQRLRIRRPFEPQNLLWEALALGAQGKWASFAGALELILQGRWARFSEFALPTAQALYTDFLTALKGVGVEASWVNQRLDSLGKGPIGALKPATGRLVLSWNLDDTDLDLHVREPGGETVSYEHKTSARGAQLYWDNTQGLGPEVYDIPQIPSEGLEVLVHYFGTSSAEGKAPACAFLAVRDPAQRWRFFTTALPTGRDDLMPIMPRWKP